MYKEALHLIEQYDTIIIHRHKNPDGDAIGSQVGLKHLICDNFPDKKVYTVGDPAKRYSFMDDCQTDEITDDVYNGALAVILDSSTKFLISDDRYSLAAKTLRFDHHIFCEKIADLEIVDTTFESCCGLLADFAKQSNLKLSPLSAKSLFTGMVTDSGRFRYDATTTRTFDLASYLMKQNLDLNDIYGKLYEDDFEMIKLRASFVLKIRFTQKNVAYIYTTKEELAELGADTFTVSRGMVGVMSDIRGVHSWVNFTETDEGILCELRSSKYNINPVAVKYGGGGHAKASGATLTSKEQAFEMLKDLDNLQGE
ncbi:MAG: bifunctional oligoribonuclease/PAP phosphatase NrnA [Corallococcus sp.]|nr:bifunctional oligoribonuclease/PAP phosphatase NrnA [Corallococcus sp.]